MLNGAKPLSNNNSWADESQSKSPKMQHSDQKEPYKNHSEKNRAYKMLKRTTKPLRRRVLTEGLAKKQHLKNTDKWHLCKAGSFSYGESPWTPPPEGTSLHR